MKKQFNFTTHSKFSLIAYLFLLMYFNSTIIQAQSLEYLQDWVQITPAPDNFFNNTASVLDDNNNLITASSTPNSNDHYDLLVVKTDKYGNTVWSQTFNVGTQGDAIAGGIVLYRQMEAFQVVLQLAQVIFHMQMVVLVI